MRHLCQVNPDTMEFEIMTGLEFLTIIVLAFAVVMVLAGLFTTGFGYGKSRVAGVIMLIMGIAVGIIWALLAGNGDLVEPIFDVDVWDVFWNGFVNLVGVLIGALVAVGIFLVAILKS